MIAKTIVDSDAFLDMPASTQNCYFHLSIRGDDEGFINNPKKIMRMINASEDDMKILIAKKFVISFESGVIVIKHWRIHNYIRADRIKETLYKDERSTLEVCEDGIYKDVRHLSVTCQPNDRIGKDRLVEVRLGKDSINAQKAFDEFWNVYPKKKSKEQARKAFAKHFDSIDSFGLENIIEKIELLKITKAWQKEGGQFIPYPASWLNAHGWEDEVQLTDNEKRAFIQDKSGMSASQIRDKMIGVER